MPTFQYQAISPNGEKHEGTLEAESRADVVRQLLGRGETATNVVPVRNGRAVRSPKPVRSTRPRTPVAPKTAVRASSGLSAFGLGSRKPTLSAGELAAFIREIATALEAGLPLMSALRTVRKQASGRAMPVILDHLIERVEAGDPLHKAAQDYGPPFNDMTIGMMRAADASGRMAEVLHQLADLMERSLELKREVMGATFYPMIVAGLIAISGVVLVTVLVPRLVDPLAGQITLPWPTVVVRGLAAFLSQYWLICGLAIVLGVVLFRLWAGVPENKLRLDRLKLKTPVLGQLLRDVAVARFTRTLGTLTTSGIPILESLRITQGTLTNAAINDSIDDVKEQVTAGKSLADPLDRSGLFPPMLVQVVSLGERTGRLDSMLLHAAKAFDRRVETSLTLFTKALPPLLLIIMAALGAFILAAILLPLLELQTMLDQQ